MADFEFEEHAMREMRRDPITALDVETVIGDADDVIYRDDGRTEYMGMLADGRQIVVILDADGRTVRTAWWRRRRR